MFFLRPTTILSITFLSLHFATLVAAQDPEEIKQLIPAATAMSAEDFKTLVTSASPNPQLIKDLTFTFSLLMLPVKASDTKEMLEGFSNAGGVPKPNKIAEEIIRGKDRTLIHADRITKFNCNFEKDAATGEVEFTVPELFRGKFSYIAVKTDAGWQITEFSIPTRDIYIEKNKEDRWVRQLRK